METYVTFLYSYRYEDHDARVLYAGPYFDTALAVAENATALYGLQTYTYVQTWIDGMFVRQIEVQN